MRNLIFPQLQPQWKESILYLKKYTQKPLLPLLKVLLKECDILGLFITLPLYGTATLWLCWAIFSMFNAKKSCRLSLVSLNWCNANKREVVVSTKMKDKNPSLCKSFNINISPTVRAQRDNLHGTEVNIIYLQKKKKKREMKKKSPNFSMKCAGCYYITRKHVSDNHAKPLTLDNTRVQYYQLYFIRAPISTADT